MSNQTVLIAAELAAKEINEAFANFTCPETEPNVAAIILKHCFPSTPTQSQQPSVAPGSGEAMREAIERCWDRIRDSIEVSGDEVEVRLDAPKLLIAAITPFLAQPATPPLTSGEDAHAELEAIRSQVRPLPGQPLLSAVQALTALRARDNIGMSREDYHKAKKALEEIAAVRYALDGYTKAAMEGNGEIARLKAALEMRGADVKELQDRLAEAEEQLDESEKREQELYWRKQYEQACIKIAEQDEENTELRKVYRKAYGHDFNPNAKYTGL